MSLLLHAGALAGLAYVLPLGIVNVADLKPDESVSLLLEPQAEPEEDSDDTVELESLSAVSLPVEPLPAEIKESKEAPQKTTLRIINPQSIPPPKESTPQNSTTHSVGKSIGLGNTRLKVFGNEAIGKKFVFLFDRSISMDGAPLEAAKAQLVTNLLSLESSHEFQIIFFNHEPEAWKPTAEKPKLAVASDENLLSAEAFIDSIRADGGTYRRAALKQALLMQPDVIYFLTDADAAMSGNDLLQAIKLARRNKIAIHTIEFGVMPNPMQENFLKQLARFTKGAYVYINTSDLLGRNPRN